MKGSRNKAFSLIELLVVVAIIGMLLAIVIPALNKAKLKVQKLSCKTNLRQWGMIINAYATDNNGSIPSSSSKWLFQLDAYNDGLEKISLCPLATDISSSGKSSPNSAYPIQLNSQTEVRYASYGINAWACNLQSNYKEVYGISTTNCWRKIERTSVPTQVPLLLDSMYEEPFADNTNIPPAFDGENTECDPINGKYQIRHICIGRHSDETNILFMDLSAREMGLKRLWRLKWHRGTDIYAPLPFNRWPEWMNSMPE